MIEVEMLGQVITHQYGTLNTGDVLLTSPEFAKHLVEDCGAAKYRAAPDEQAEQATSAEQATPHEPAAEPAEAAVVATPAPKSRAKK